MKPSFLRTYSLRINLTTIMDKTNLTIKWKMKMMIIYKEEPNNKTRMRTMISMSYFD